MNEEGIANMVKKPANFINKAKKYITKNFNDLEKEHPVFSEFHLEKPDSLVGKICQKICITKDTLIHFEKHVNAFFFNNGSLLGMVITDFPKHFVIPSFLCSKLCL